MAKYLPLPDGSSLEVPDSMPLNEAVARAKQAFPELYGGRKEAGPQGGFTPALKAGISGLKGDIAALAGKTGLMDEAAAEKKIQEEAAYRAKTFKPTEESWSEAPVTKVKELLGGSLPYMAAPVAAGFLAPEGAAALGATGLASLAQFTGSNLSRQMDEGKTLKEAALGSAAAAAIPQAALDVVSLKMLPGIRNIFGQAGKKMSAAEAKAFTEQGIAKIAGDYALSTGKAMGAEGLTEAGQQFFERMQAGLNLSDDKARDEYWDSLVGGAVLGGVLSPAGRFMERGDQKGEAKAVLAKEKRKEELAARQAAAAQRQAEIAAEAARKETPEYMDEVEAKYKALLDQKAQLDAVADGTTAKGDLAAEDAKRIARNQRKALMNADETKALLADYNAVKAKRAALAAQPEQAEMFPETGVGGNLPGAAAVTQAEQERAGYGAQANAQAQMFPELPAPPSTAGVRPALPETTPDYAQQARALKTQVEPLQTAMLNTSNLQKKLELGNQINQIQAAITEAETAAKKQAKSPMDQIKALAYQMSAAELNGDHEAQIKIAQKLLDLGVTDLSKLPTEFELKAIKPQVSESTESFNQRVIGPEMAAGREAAAAQRQKFESDKAALQRMSEQKVGEEYARDVRQEHQTRKEVGFLEDQARMNRGQTAQGLLFGGEQLDSTQISGAGTIGGKTRARLLADLQIARASGNRAAAAEAVAALKEQKAREAGETTEQSAFNFADLQKAAGTEAPAKVKEQQDATDKRDTAYANLVDLVSKYNQGKAKKEAVDRARDFLLENLAKDIETSRGRPLTTAEQLQLQNQANALLDDLVNRFGDTRNVSSVGTKRDQAFMPAQNEKGEFNKEKVPGMGYFTAESKGPGYRTFSSPYAAAMSIQEGLDSLRNQGVRGQLGATATEVTQTPAHTTPEMVRNQLDRLLAQDPAQTDPEVRQRAVQIADNLGALDRHLEAVSDYLNNPSPERAREVDALLAGTERAKRSETETPKRETAFGTAYGAPKTAVQAELPGVETAGTVFATQKEFDDYLAGDALDKVRKDQGLVAQTVSRLKAIAAPFAKKAEGLRTKLASLQARFATTQQVAADEVDLAKSMTEEAKANLKAVVDRLDAELHGLQIAYIQANTAFNFAANTADEISANIEANARNYTEPQRKALSEYRKAKRALAKAVQAGPFPEHPKAKVETWAFSRGPKDRHAARLVTLQNDVVRATQAYRAAVARGQTQTAIVKFLDADLNLQMQLQNELAEMDRAGEDMINAGVALELAKQKQDRSYKNKAAIKNATSDIDAALQIENEAMATAQAQKTAAMAEMTGVQQELAAAEKEAGKADTVAERQRKQRERDQELLYTETIHDREERDREQRRLENEMRERLSAIPGERLDFSKRREMMNVVDSARETEDEINQNIEDAKRALEQIDKNIEQQKTVIQDSQVTIDVLKPKKRLGAKQQVELTRAEQNLADAKAALEKSNASKTVFEGVIEKGESGITRLNKRVAEIKEAFTNDPEVLAKVQKSVERRIASRKKKIEELSAQLNKIRDVEKNQEARGKLKHEIAKKKREMRELETLVEKERGLTRTTLAASERTLDNLRKLANNPQAPKNVRNAANAKLNEQQDLAAERALEAAPEAANREDVLSRIELLEQERIVNDPDATPKEQMAARDKIAADEAAGGPARRNLQTRKIGPVVKDVRTGKTTQAGKAKPITGLQAQRGAAKAVGFEQAMLELDRISDLRDKLEVARENATKANNTERLEQLAQYEKRLDKAQRTQEKAIGKFRPVLRTAVTSTGPSLRADQVTKIANAVVKDWAKVPNIEVVDNVEDLLPRIQQQLREENGADVEVPGLYDPETDTVFLISSALRTGEDVALTVMHEIAGHYGLRQMLGGAYARMMNDLYNGNKSVKEKADAKMAANNKLTREIAVEEVLADAAENAPYANQQIRNALRRVVAAIKQWLRDRGLLKGVSDFEVNQLVADARRYVRQGVGGRGGEAAMSRAVLRTAPKYAEENELTELADTIIAKPKSFMERLGNNLGLEFEMNAVDMRAGLREALKAGAEELGNNDLYTQAMYSVTKADQAMPLIQASLGTGPLEMYQDARGLFGIRSTGKDSAKGVFEAISELPGENSQAKVALATTYMIAQRAFNKGLSALDIGNLGVTQEMLDAAMAKVQSDPALEKQLELVRARYNAYNKGQINFLASTGAITKAFAQELLKDGDYVPYYRVRSDGTAELVYGNERTITVGDIRHQPYLAELKGGETKILPLDQSIMRNTMLITRKGLINLAQRNVAYAMQDFGKERGEIDEKTGKLKDLMPIKKGQGPAGPDVIHFNQEPDPNDSSDDGRRWLRVRTQGTAMEGIPAELVVKSLEGAHLTLPAFLKLGGIAGDMLRKGVTRMPMYILRQLYRDPMAATFTAGLDYAPLTAVMKAGGEFIRMSQDKSGAGAKLMEKGLIQSNLFTGDPDDMSAFALQLASGKDLGAINRMFAFIDRASMRADSATRALVYDNAIKKGLSEVEADMMVMESMNFYKRGLSPTIQYANRLIPFMNAQIQGLNVLVKAARGNMTSDEVLQIKRKFVHNATMLAATGVLYAMAMEDDDYYKNAKPRDKYSNMFLHLPGVEEPLKIAIPYEAGWSFSAGVAMVDALREKSDGAQQWKAIKDMFLSAVPGYSSGFMPQAVKPVYEMWSNKNLFSGQNIEPMSVRDRLPEDRYVAATTETAKALAKVLPGVSPIMVEHLARSYFGTLPLAVMASVDSFFETKGVEPTKRASEMALVGSAFQKKYGGADMDVVYDLSKEALQTKASFNDLRKTGTPEEVREFAKEHRSALTAAPIAAAYQTNMGRLRIDQDRVRTRTDMSEDEKRARIDALDARRQEITETFMSRLKRIEERS